MSQMLKSSGSMGVATLLSRILGMAREVLYANFMGAGLVAGAFKLAFMIPNLFRRLLGEGALTAAFIPIFKEKEMTEGEASMWHSANAVISALILSASAIIALVVTGISVVLAFAPESLSPDRILMLRLLRLMFPYMLLVCMAAVFMGMLNARGQFFLPAMGATVLNSVMITVVLFVAPRWGERLENQIFALAIGVLVAGSAQMLYQVPALRREGFRFGWVPPFHNETVRQVVRKMIPGMMGVAAFQLNVLITQGIAYAVDPQIFAWFDYSVRLMELPQGMFGISLATYLLPTLAGLAAEKKYPEFRATLGQGLGYLAFANMIATVLLIVLAEPIVRLLFEHGQFSAVDTRNVAFALACLAPGLIAFSVVNILARAFYALGDTTTPMKISTVCLALNVIFTLWLIRPLGQGGMGIANTMSALFNVWFLLFGLRKKLKFLGLSPLVGLGLNMLGAGLIGAMVAWVAFRAWDGWAGSAGLLPRIGAVFIPMAMAGLTYWLVLLWLKAPHAQEFLALVRKRLGKNRR